MCDLGPNIRHSFVEKDGLIGHCTFLGGRMTVEDVNDLRTARWGCSLDHLGMRPEPDSERPAV